MEKRDQSVKNIDQSLKEFILMFKPKIAGSLIIGDLKEKPLAELLSLSNDPYRTLIESQMKGQFDKNCRASSSYRSIYDDR